MAPILANEQVVTLALYKLGGIVSPIHTEEIAIEAFRLAPERFRWQLEKYKTNINLSYVYNALTDARKKDKGGYITGNLAKGWTLTAEGLALAERVESTKKDVGAGRRRSLNLEQEKRENWKKRQVARIVEEPAFKKVTGQLKNPVTKPDLMNFFQIDDYLKADTRNKRVQQFRTMFYGDAGYESAINELAKIYEDDYADK